MKNILAENLLRFGVKNFSNEDLYRVSQLLKEQFALPAKPTIDLAKLRVNADFKSAEDIVKAFMSRSKILTSIEDASAYILLGQVANGFNLTDTYKLLVKNLDKGIQQLTRMQRTFTYLAQNLVANDGETLIQFNESPDALGKVLIQGTMTATSYAASDVPNGAADINDIVTYMNNYNILANCTTGGSGFAVSPAGELTSQGGNTNDFNTRAVKKGQPGYGAFLPDEAFGGAAAYLYALKSFKAASAQTTVGIKTDVTYTPGPELGSNLGPQLFKTGTITPEPALAQRVKEAVDAAKSLGTIISARIISGASFDRPVKGTREQFAQTVGMPVDKVPMDVNKDQLGVVKDPMSGGNAFLAYYRGIAIKNAMGNQAGVTPTIEAIVAKGGETDEAKDAAQYAKIMFSVKKADETTVVTSDDIKSIGEKSSSNELGGKFQCIRISI